MIENRLHQCNFVYGGYEWEGVGLQDFYWVVPYNIMMSNATVFDTVHCGWQNTEERRDQGTRGSYDRVC